MSSPQNDVPWVLLFCHKLESIDEKRAFQNYRRMAAEYKGKVRFAWVEAREEELLAASFDARFTPQTFYVKDGTAYWYRDFQSETHLSSYIDENRQGNSTTSFAQPRRFMTLQLYIYTYPRKTIRNIYRQHIEWELRRFLAYSAPSFGNLMPHVTEVVHYVYWSLIWLIIAGPSCLYLVCCRLRCCRGKKTEQNEIPYLSSSRDDILKKD